MVIIFDCQTFPFFPNNTCREAVLSLADENILASRKNRVRGICRVRNRGGCRIRRRNAHFPFLKTLPFYELGGGAEKGLEGRGISPSCVGYRDKWRAACK